MENNGTPAPELGGMPDTKPEITMPTYSPETIALMEKKQWKTDADITKGYTELEKFVGKDPKTLLTIPADEKDEVGWNNIYNRLGRPETAEGYKFENKTGIKLDAESMKTFAATAHKMGFTQKQFEAGMAAHLAVFQGADAKATEIYNAEIKACDDALAKEWGEERQKKTSEALEVAKKIGIYDTLEELKLGSNPKAIKMLDTLRQMMADDEIKPSGDKGKLSTQDEIKSILANPAYINGLHPEHGKVMDRLKVLYGVK
jgi:hypothetical protein